MPNILNQKDNIKRIEDYLSSKTNTTIKTNNLRFKISPLLKLTAFADSIDLGIQNTNILIQNLSIKNDTLTFSANIKIPYIKSPILIGNKGELYIKDNKLFSRNLEVSIDNSKIYIEGLLFDKDKNRDFYIKGENIPAADVSAMLLYWQKSQDPAKKFIENFKNFSGNIDLNLNIQNQGIFGNCIAKNLGAEAVWFDIPIFFPDVVFDFKGKTITSYAKGFLGQEKATHKLDITDLGSDKKEVIGTFSTTLAKKFRYVPNLAILNNVQGEITYKIKEKKIDVYYSLDIPEGSDLIYNTSYLGLREYKRKITAHTLKDCDDLHLEHYEYSMIKDNQKTTVVSGEGLFIKINDKYTPQFITCKTSGYAPVSVAGSFGEKISGGQFRGELKYDFIKEKIFGTFDIINARYKDFYVDLASVSANQKDIKINTSGSYKKEDFRAQMRGKNDFSGSILIYNMELFLNRLIINSQNQEKPKTPKINPDEITKKAKNSDITIENWEVKINQIKRDKVVLDNVRLLGNLKNNDFKFNMEDLSFAKGILSAKGNYNFNDKTSHIDFKAKDINSNLASNMIFDLENQIEGIANATLHLDGFNAFKNIKAKCDFEILDGFLPKVGNMEFMIKSAKFKVSDIINIDLTRKQALKSDIKGSLYLLDNKLKDINITSKQEYLSLFLTGNYDIIAQCADIHLFGKYNKQASKGVRILFVPLNWILKIVFRPEKTNEDYSDMLSKIPSINAKEKDTKYFRIKFTGDINKGKLDNLIIRNINP